jgi:hypothetical protein
MYQLVPSRKRVVMRFVSRASIVIEFLLIVFVAGAHYYHPHTVTASQLLFSVVFGVAGILGSLIHLRSRPQFRRQPNVNPYRAQESKASEEPQDHV